jgi:hypothetical protein
VTNLLIWMLVGVQYQRAGAACCVNLGSFTP